jgi:hypothetical protein
MCQKGNPKLAEFTITNPILKPLFDEYGIPPEELSPVDVILMAQDLLKDANHWTTGMFAKFFKEGTYNTYPGDPQATCWCIAGAVMAFDPLRTKWHVFDGPSPSTRAWGMLDRAAAKMHQRGEWEPPRGWGATASVLNDNTNLDMVRQMITQALADATEADHRPTTIGRKP